MLYPKFLNAGGTIGVCAPSCGVMDELKIKRFENGKKNLNKKGINVIFSDHVFTADERGVSADGITRAKELHEFFKNEKVSVILSASGGDFLMEMLKYVDLDVLKDNPTWFQGYSDNTHLTHFLTTKCDMASIYGFNFGDFGMKVWEDNVNRGFDILRGNIVKQNSFEYYESDWHDDETGLGGYYHDDKVKWVNARDEDEIVVKGRMIGGCLDIISFIGGTPYDGTFEFINKYKNDGILWFLESFSLNAEELSLTLWRLKESGFFEGASGFVFGRPCMFKSFTGIDYKRAVLDVLGELDVPIILDACIGHRGPQFSIINGSIGTFRSSGGKGSLVMELK